MRGVVTRPHIQGIDAFSLMAFPHYLVALLVCLFYVGHANISSRITFKKPTI